MYNYEKHIVAFLDILGFKQIINRSGFEEVLTIFRSVISNVEADKALYHAVDIDSNASEINWRCSIIMNLYRRRESQ